MLGKPRYKKLFDEATYKKYYEVDDKPADDENANQAAGGPAFGGDAAANTGAATPDTTVGQDQGAQAAAPTDDQTGDQQAPAEDEKTDEQAEEEKQKELDLQGTVSNIFSEIAERISKETFKYYKVVEEAASRYMNEEVKVSNEKKKELLKQFTDVGLKIISNAKKNNFIDKDNIAFMAIIEGYIEIMKRIDYDKKKIGLANEED